MRKGPEDTEKSHGQRPLEHGLTAHPTAAHLECRVLSSSPVSTTLLIRCAFWALPPSACFPSCEVGCARGPWFLSATAVSDSKQPLKGLDGVSYTRNCSALARGDEEGVLLLNGELKFKLRQILP